MRIGVIALLHESNTFSSQPTTLAAFRENTLLTGEPIRAAMRDAHHEVGGFFAGLGEADAEAVPMFAARALPSGTITEADFAELVSQLLAAVEAAGPLDGYLVAPHGATVSERHRDADGYWLRRLREFVGDEIPIIATLDAHANLSREMVTKCNAIVAYRTNPHLDQRDRGTEAARLMARTVRGEIRPTMAAVLPPLAISIDRQCTDEPHLSPLYDFANEQLTRDSMLSNSVLLGFPYADVAEMGSAVVVVTDDDVALASAKANELATRMWEMRAGFAGSFTSVDAALDQCEADTTSTICLLDMGDNVGGGSSADGTALLRGLVDRQLGPSFVCIFDPVAVERCRDEGLGNTLTLPVGGHTDTLHGEPVSIELTVTSLHDGRFQEPEPRHGGIANFDQGPTAICETQAGATIMLTSRRMVPFSLQQLKSCGLDPSSFRILVAKGVNAPIAAYREVCGRFIRVNTIGSTCADMSQLTYQHRRCPLFALEETAEWSAGAGEHVVVGHDAK